MTEKEKIDQAEREHNFDKCPSCNKVVPVELVFFNPDLDDEPTLIECLICRTGIRFI